MPAIRKTAQSWRVLSRLFALAGRSTSIRREQDGRSDGCHNLEKQNYENTKHINKQPPHTSLSHVRREEASIYLDDAGRRVCLSIRSSRGSGIGTRAERRSPV